MSLQGTVVPKSIVNRQLQRTNMLVNSRPRAQHVRRQKHTKGVVNKLEKETKDKITKIQADCGHLPPEHIINKWCEKFF